ncbi:alpha/beta hydrolase fold-3 domain-containing protein [Xylariaceae sp. FL0255]|nr:alpha/beta hydrolase fold-3 domain-containing protein [Xylariaceae sp. FL0255]
MSSSKGFPLVSYQPFRLLYQVLYISTIILRVPYITGVALVPHWRPHAGWSAKQTFMTRLLYRILHLASRIGITDTLTLKPGSEGERFQVVKPSSSDVYLGPLASTTVKPATIGGTWYPRVPKTGGKTIFLYFHGGAFVQGDGRDASCGPLAKKLLEKGGASAVFAVQYRLSGYGGQNPYPAALQDALSSYLYLLNVLHIPADHIAIAGDSAGGNLAMALLLYLRNFGAKSRVPIPTPKSAVLISPWVAPFDYNRRPRPYADSDFVPKSYAAWGAHTYAGDWPNAPADPYITQLGNPFSIKVPIFVSIGTAEILYESVLEWTEQMRATEGNVVEVYHEEGAAHDTFLVSELCGFEKSAWEVAKRIGAFVEEH